VVVSLLIYNKDQWGVEQFRKRNGVGMQNITRSGERRQLKHETWCRMDDVSSHLMCPRRMDSLVAMTYDSEGKTTDDKSGRGWDKGTEQKWTDDTHQGFWRIYHGGGWLAPITRWTYMRDVQGSKPTLWTCGRRVHIVDNLNGMCG